MSIIPSITVHPTDGWPLIDPSMEPSRRVSAQLDAEGRAERAGGEEGFWRRKAQQGVRYNRAYWNLLQVEPAEIQAAVPGLTPEQAEQALAFFKSVADEPVVRPMKKADRESAQRWPSRIALDVRGELLRSASHRKGLVYGEVEVCETCPRNVYGAQVAWDDPHHAEAVRQRKEMCDDDCK